MRLTCAILLMLMSSICFSQEKSRTDRVPEETTGRLVHRLVSLKHLKINPNYNPPPSRTQTGLIIKKTFKENTTDYGSAAGKDKTIQRKTEVPEASMRLGSVITSNNDGMAYTSVSPADPTIAVGPSHIIQMVNGAQGAFLTVFDKAGNTLIPKQYMHDLLYTPNYFGYGDPVVLYDVFSNRYFISEFGSDSCANCFANSLIIGVSASEDPTAGWNFYKFNPGNFFIDFPKYAAWPNLLFASTNDYSSNGRTYAGSSVYAFDKAAMIAGNRSVALQRLRLPPSDYPKFISMSPVNISGNTAPVNPDEGLFAYFSDDNRTESPDDVDSLGIVKFKPDFSNPPNSVLSFEAPLVVAPFKSRVCNGSRNCVPSASGDGYDDLSDRFMNKVYLRNFGNKESIVLNHTVDANYPEMPSLAGIRWYELERSNGPWSIKQQGTYAPDDDGRFMASMNINASGQIGMIFNHSGPGKYASLYFTGRNVTDEPGKMSYFEFPVVVGDAYGTFSNRWGDYNELVLDPVDDSTFWLAGMYGSSTWRTRISSFKLQALPTNDLRIINVQSPPANYASCNDTFSPIITIRNNGIIEQDSIHIETYIDNNLQATFEVSLALPPNQNRTISLPTITSPKGKHTIRFSVQRSLNMPDEDPTNDDAQLEYTIISPLDSMVAEGFESTFVPFQWRVLNANPNSTTWEQSMLAGRVSNSSVVNRLFENQVVGDTDLLISPPLLVTSSDSLILSFDRAYKMYGRSGSFADTLEVLVSSDCGQTYVSAWKKGGTALASVFGTVGTGFVPGRSDWLSEQIDLKPFTSTASQITVAFKSVSRFGQNIYLDNISITPINRRNIDLALQATGNSMGIVCAGSFKPIIEVSNKGLDSVRSFKVMLLLTDQVVDSLEWAGTISPSGSLTIPWSRSISLSPGQYSVNMFLASVNNHADQQQANDTIAFTLTSFGAAQSKLQEGFETHFPPSNWRVNASSRGYSWRGTDNIGRNSLQSALAPNNSFNSNGLHEDLVSPILQVPGVDSTILVFEHAYRKPTASLKEDTLEILVTTDCGNTYQSVFRQWGNDLNTIPSADPDPVYPPDDTVGFVPLNAQWRLNRVDLSKAVKGGGSFQVVFRSTSNEGSNLFLDNITVYGVISPRLLKQNGYQVYPNPFTGRITIRHYQRAGLLREVIIFNPLGQRLYTRKFVGNAPDSFSIDLGQHANGIYHVQLVYTDKKITERIIKVK